MKKEFEKAEVEVIEFDEKADVVTASAEGLVGGGEGMEED